MASAAVAVKQVEKQRTSLVGLKPTRIEAPWTVLVYGIPGIGKTTFAANMPKPIFICAEKGGADELNVVRYPDRVSNWNELREAIKRLTNEEHDFKTLVIDTIDDIEPWCWEMVVKTDPKAHTIEDVGGGFQKGYNVALDEWRKLLSDFEQLSTKRGMNIVLLAHCTRREQKNPQAENFDRWEPNIHKKAAGLIVGWCKTVLFAQEETTVKIIQRGEKPKAVSSGERVLRTIWNAAYDAKNRHSLPDPLPLDAAIFEQAMKAGFARQPSESRSPDEIRASISDKLSQISDQTVTDKVSPLIEAASDDIEQLTRIDNRLTATIKARKGAGNE